MTKSRFRAIVVIAASLTTLSFAPSAFAFGETVCKWGGDESESMRCFDCMHRVWDGYAWRLVNTCRPRYTPQPFAWP